MEDKDTISRISFNTFFWHFRAFLCEQKIPQHSILSLSYLIYHEKDYYIYINPFTKFCSILNLPSFKPSEFTLSYVDVLGLFLWIVYFIHQRLHHYGRPMSGGILFTNFELGDKCLFIRSYLQNQKKISKKMYTFTWLDWTLQF